MQTKYLINGTNVNIVQFSAETALNHLPPRVYSVQFNKFTGYYLAMIKDKLQTPEKIYGGVLNRVRKCITSYTEREFSTGVLLTGDKGTGKSLLVALLANYLITEMQIPVILVRDAHNGEAFDNFIQSVGECCLIFDEFGKMYSTSSRNDDRPSQSTILGLLDGVDKTKRMVLLTENSEFDISEFLLNRPSRVYYHFRYRKLDELSINEYCLDKGIMKNVVTEVIELSRRCKIFSFDMLQSIVEEHIRFGESIDLIVKELNIDTSRELRLEIEIVKVLDKTTNKEVKFHTLKVDKPLTGGDYTYIELDEKDTDGDNIQIYFTANDLSYENAGKCVYEHGDYIVTTKDLPFTNVNYSKYF